jgi:multidrug efflux pump
VFVSGIIALTLSPMMCAKMLRANEEPGKFERTVHDLLDRMTARYDAMLHAVMQKRIVVILFAVIVFASLPLLFKFIPSELAPSEDKGVMAVLGTAPSNANLDYIENTMADVNKVLDDQPEIAYSQVFSGCSTPIRRSVSPPWCPGASVKRARKRCWIGSPVW